MMGGLFSMEGRYNRARYFWTTFFLILVILALSVVLGLFIVRTGGDPETVDRSWLVISIAATVLIAFQDVKRFHDLDRPGTHFWLLLIPVYNIYLGLLLLFKKGTAGENTYGPDPLTRVAK